jgi:hypothetical protein
MLPENGLATASPHAAQPSSSHHSASPLAAEADPQPRSGADLPPSTVGGLGNQEAADLLLSAAGGDAQAEPLAPPTPVVAL